jgi:hypothetical protein
LFKRFFGSADELAEDQKKQENGEAAGKPPEPKKQPAPELEPEEMPAFD